MRRAALIIVVIALGSVPGLSAQPAQAPATIETVAGTGVDGHDGDVGPATAAAISHPRGIAIRPSGAFVFAEPFVPSIRTVGPPGSIPRRIQTGILGTAQLNLPHGVGFLPDGSTVIADTGNHRILRTLSDGTISTIAGTGTFGFSGDGGLATAAQIAAPRGIATLGDGGILFPDSGNHRIRLISPTGIITTVAGTGTAGFSGDGGSALSAQLNLPFSVSPLASGGYLIADAGNNRIRRVAPNGTITTSASEAGFDSPHAVAALPDGGFLVADTDKNRVVRVFPGGAFTTVAGTGAAGFSGDGGPAATAQLNAPKALAVLPDLSGFLVGDSANNRVRQVTLDLRLQFELRVLVKQVRTTAGRPATLRYTLSERAVTRLEVVRRGSVVLRVRQQGKAGANALNFGRTLKAGSYGLRLRATAIGNRSDSETASLSVRKRRG
jgi:hypothetical protein